MTFFLKSLLIVVSTSAIFLAEMSHAYRKRSKKYYLGHLLVNLSLWFINTLLNPLLIIATLYLIDNFAINWRPGWLTIDYYSTPFFVWVVLLDVLIIDLFIYFWHRANHSIPFLWRFHQVHHADRIMDFTTGLRFHFGEVVLSALVRIVIILVFDINFQSVLVAETLLLTMSLFQHSNFRISITAERFVSKLLVTPGIHWVHHHQIHKDTDSNYANIFSFWDVLFRSRSTIRRFEGMPIGIEGEHKTGGIWQQITRPFVD